MDRHSETTFDVTTEMGGMQRHMILLNSIFLSDTRAVYPPCTGLRRAGTMYSDDRSKSFLFIALKLFP